jgi:hypothetical protein
MNRGRQVTLPEKKKEMNGDLERLRETTERLEGDLEVDEAIDLLEKSVEEVERFGARLGETES